jgi:hypothetical protein
MGIHYLIDFEYIVDEDALVGTTGHLLVFNPGPRNAELQVTVYYEDREPDDFHLTVPAGTSGESNYEDWPVVPNVRFALEVQSSEPVVCQFTGGWNNTKNDFSSEARTRSPQGIRECSKSYMAITQLGRDWYVADGIVIDMPERMWVRESEWAVLLNPGHEDAQVTIALHYDDRVAQHTVDVPARRVKRVYMDDIARRNLHYGIHFSSDRPVAAQWLRTVNWFDRSELMTYWSVPCVPGTLD